MTRAERLLQDKRRREERIRQEQRKLSQTRREMRSEAEKERVTRRKRVGLLADEAGLLAWDDTTLGSMFQLLARLTDCPDPVAVLDALLSDADVVGIRSPHASVMHNGENVSD